MVGSFLDRIRDDAAFDAERLCVNWAKSCLCHGKSRSVSVDCVTVDQAGRDTSYCDIALGKCCAHSALDRFIREFDYLRGRWALAVFDACGKLDLRTSMETPFHAPALPDARIPWHSGVFLAHDRRPCSCHSSRTPACICVCSSEYPCRRSVLLHLAEQDSFS